MNIGVITDERRGKGYSLYRPRGVVGSPRNIALSRHAQERGAAAVSLIPPNCYHSGQAEVVPYHEDAVNAIDLVAMGTIGTTVNNRPKAFGLIREFSLWRSIA